MFIRFSNTLKKSLFLMKKNQSVVCRQLALPLCVSEAEVHQRCASWFLSFEKSTVNRSDPILELP